MPDPRPRTRFIFVTGGVVSSLGKGISAASIGRLLVSRGLKVAAAEVRPLHQHRPRDDVAVPARRGLRHRGRRGDRPRPRPLRALHGREHVARLQRHGRRGLPLRHPQGAPRRLPRRHGPGRAAHHGRDQAPHPARRREPGRRRADHGDRRHGRRHRVAAVPRGDPPVPRRRRAPPLHVHPPHARALHRPRGRAQDQADAALGQRAAPHRHPARHGRLPLRGRRCRRTCGARSRCSPPCRRTRSSPPATSTTSTRSRSSSVPRASTTSCSSTSAWRRSRPRSATGSASCAAPPRRRSAAVRIALVGKYVKLEDAYLSVAEALRHSGFQHGCGIEIDWVDSETLDDGEVRARLLEADGILIPGGFGGARDRGQDRGGAASRASSRSRSSASASACRWRWPTSRATWSAWTARTPRSSTPRPRTP